MGIPNIWLIKKWALAITETWFHTDVDEAEIMPQS